MAEKVVIVTGATGALGRAVAAAFQANGDIVVPVARSSKDWSYDLAQPGAAQELVSKVADRFGGVDVVAHTVGAFAPGGLEDAGAELWTRMFDVNLRTTVAMLESALPHLKASRAGRFVGVGSRAGTVASPGASAYAASKAAMHSLISAAAEELKGTGVTVNAVLPSTMDTEANRSWGKPEQIETWVKPEAVAQAILWLASDLAADVTGCLLPVYGSK